MKCIEVLCVLGALVASGLAFQCPTCAGPACDLDTIPDRECTVQRPFFSLSRIIQADTNYGCVSLEYLQDGDLQKLRQCVVLTSEKEVCDSFKSVYDVKNCILTTQMLSAADDGQGDGENGDGGDGGANADTSPPTTTPTTTSPTTTTSATTTTNPTTTTTNPTTTTTNPTTTTTNPTTTTQSTQKTTSKPNPADRVEVTLSVLLLVLICTWWM